MSTNRRIFNYDDMKETKIIKLNDKKGLYENTITACGCMFYKKSETGIELLLISYSDPKWNKLDDFGGRIDEDDESVFHTIIREVGEETNNIITEKILQKYISKNKYKSFYNSQSKYYVIVIEVNNKFFPDTDVFGDFENADKIKRKINWYDYEENKKDIAFRLFKNNKLISFLNSELEDM